MIVLKNGHALDFACASGALAWTGDGWWWEAPLRWLGYINPHELTIIAKTLTYSPRKGNLRMWCPWRCVRLVPGGAINAVCLTNPGYVWWIKHCCPRIVRKGYKGIASIMPNNGGEAVKMTRDLNACEIVGIEINASCPNVDHDRSIQHVIDIVSEVVRSTSLPVIVKLGYTDPYVDICNAWDRRVDAFDLINTIPWKFLHPNEPSPLAKYGLEGGVSGLLIRDQARDAISKVKLAGVKTPLISGGGIDSVEEVFARRLMGAGAFTIGTLFLRKPWKPRKIIRQCREVWSKKDGARP